MNTGGPAKQPIRHEATSTEARVDTKLTVMPRIVVSRTPFRTRGRNSASAGYTRHRRIAFGRYDHR